MTVDGRPQTAESQTGAYQVRCPHCHALQFLARSAWECVAIDEATLAIKCWRRTCKVVLGLRPVSSVKCQVSSSESTQIEVSGG